MSTESTNPVVAMMLAERYGPSLWWKTTPKPAADVDGELTTARRRRVLLAAVADVAEEESA